MFCHQNVFESQEYDKINSSSSTSFTYVVVWSIPIMCGAVTTAKGEGGVELSERDHEGALDLPGNDGD